MVSPWPGEPRSGAFQNHRVLQGAGQIKLDGRAVPDLAIDAKMAAGLLGEAINHRESQAGTLADRLGREERIDRLRHNFGRHARTRVGNPDST